MRLAGANVVITGGSRGIGEKMAEEFATAGANLLLVARSEDALPAVVERVGGSYLVADLATEEGVDGLVDRCRGELGSIDVWVNNAGIETEESFVTVDRDRVRQLVRVNFEALALLTRDVGVTVVAQGPVDTEMWDRILDNPFMAAPLRRFRLLGFLPTVDAAAVAKRAVAGVAKERSFVRYPARYNVYNFLNGAPPGWSSGPCRG